MTVEDLEAIAADCVQKFGSLNAYYFAHEINKLVPEYSDRLKIAEKCVDSYFSDVCVILKRQVQNEVQHRVLFKYRDIADDKHYKQDFESNKTIQ